MRTKHDLSRPVVQFDERSQESVKALIANMIITPAQAKAGVVTRIHEQSKYKIEPDMLPGPEWLVGRMTLRILDAMAAEGIPATKEAILNRLSLEAANEQQAQEFERYFEAINNYRTVDADVAFMAFNLREWMDKAVLMAAGKKALARVTDPELTAEQAYIEFMKIMSTAAPRVTNIRTVSDDFIMFHRKKQDERLERVRSGRPVGPNFPWTGLNEKIAGLKLGELCTFLAKSGFGKTTIGMIIAEHMGHVQGYDVGYFHLETTAESLADRFIARKLRLPTGALRNPQVFDHTKEPYKSIYDKVQASWETRNSEKGRITLKGAPGMSPSVFKAEVEQLAAEASGRGKELVVIVDYYTEFDWTELPGAKDMYAGYNLLASYMKYVAEVAGVYMICFGQYGVDEEYSGKKAGFGGQKINQRSQIVIQVERQSDAEDDLIVEKAIKSADGTEVKVQRTDTVGLPMFYHRKGEIHSNSVFRVVKANDDRLGPVPVQFVNAYFEILDNQGGPTEIARKPRAGK